VNLITASKKLFRQRRRDVDWKRVLPLDEPVTCLGLTRYPDGPGVRIDNVIRIAVTRDDKHRLVLVIEAPADMKIVREELLLDPEAASISPGTVP
jgi:sRNA-binding carbon storage regulator CsrA